MTPVRPRKGSSVFKTPRYWYHISSTLTNKREYLTPRGNEKGFNRASSEPDVKRTCVAPSLEHCLTAVPYAPGDTYVIYRTTRKVKPTEAHDIFDAKVTHEGWITTPMMFERIGTINLSQINKEHTIVEEAASGDDPRRSGRVLAWWKRIKPKRYVKPA